MFMEIVSQLQSQNKSLQHEHGYLFEYLLVATPSEEVYKQVMDEKQSFFNTYHEKVSIKTKPHITIANFLAKEAMEETIIRWMNRAVGTQPSFPVVLNNFGGFPPHTIYIRVQQRQPFKQLATALQSINHYIRSNDCPPMRLITNPHLTIARRLPPDIFEKAIWEYSHKAFEASFVIDKLTLLRRQHQFDACKQISSFHLASGDNLLFN